MSFLRLKIKMFNFCFVIGVAIGAGWQALVAYINIGCYYIFGIPLGLSLGYMLGLGVQVTSPQSSFVENIIIEV